MVGLAVPLTSTVVDFFAARYIARSQDVLRRRALLTLSPVFEVIAQALPQHDRECALCWEPI
jgi:hypothetical protein